MDAVHITVPREIEKGFCGIFWDEFGGFSSLPEYHFFSLNFKWAINEFYPYNFTVPLDALDAAWRSHCATHYYCTTPYTLTN